MANEYLKRTPTSTGNNRVFTWSGWVKRNIFAANYAASQNLFRASGGSGGDCGWRFDLATPADSLRLFLNGAASGNVQADGKNRDASAWMHVMVSFNSTLDQDSERIRIYVNGVRVPDNNTGYPTINYQTSFNERVVQAIGAWDNSGSPTEFLGGQLADVFLVDGQALTPDVFGFYKQGKGYISAGSTQATDFRPGQWVPKTPRVIKTEINRRGGFGVNGFYLPMNDSNNFGADFHGDPNSIITLNEKLPQPRVGVATTASVGLGYTDALRADPYAANLVLALPFVSGGLSSGFGDYSHIIRGSGSAKSITVSGNTTITNVGTAETASVFYGSGVKFDGVDDYITIPNSSDFSFGSGDFTVECWANFGNFSTATSLVNVFENATARRSWSMEGRSSGGFRFEWWYDGSTSQSIDASANTLSRGQWNHFAMVRKGPTITGYINGVAIGIKTDVGSQSLFNNTTDPLVIGALFTSGTPVQDFTGYIQDLRVYKGIAKYKGGFDVPKPYTPVGIATWRAVPDCTANNFATMNPLIEARPVSGTDSPASSSVVTFAGGNLDLTNSANAGSAQRMVSFATIGISTGRWYWEVRADSNSRVGLSKGFQQRSYQTNFGSGSGLEATVTYEGSSGTVAVGNTAYYSTATTLTAPTYNTSNIIGVAVSANNGLNNLIVQWFKDGVGVATLTGVGATSPVLEWFPSKMMVGSADPNDQKFNFGQNPTFSGNTTAGTFTDSNGKGLFKYQPPSGFLALCEDNLPTPAIADPGKHFKTVLWTGDGNNGRSIVGVGFTPDLIWYKPRNVTGYHGIVDSVRGAGIQIYPNDTLAEAAGFYQSSFDSNGFGVNYNASGSTNNSGSTYVAWCWRAGAGTTSTNTNGSITSVVSVNQDAGFSIVSYTGNGSSPTTVGHGLTKAPRFIIFKCRNAAVNWFVYHGSMGPSGIFEGLNTNSAYSASATAVFNNTAPSSSVITLGGVDSNTNGRTYIAYCWAEIEGFSKFGSYVGNGNADGPFVYCGFKPAWIMIKRTAGAADWVIHDSSRTAVNPSDTALRPNTTDIDLTATTLYVDFLSNGFKIRNANGSYNNAETYAFAAFAESPFQTANSK